jgi:integrase
MFRLIMGDEMGDAQRAERTPRAPSKALTARAVESAKEPGKYFDGNGLYLRVDKSGLRLWVQRIVIRGKRREIGLGSPDLVSLSTARENARRNRQLAYEGQDPIQLKNEARAVPTFAEAARTVHELHKPTWRNEKHAAQFISTLETYAFPAFGTLRVSEVTSADLMKALAPIWTAKQETARRVRQRIGVVLKWAMAKGWRKDNPADAVSLALPKVDKSTEHRKSLPYAEVCACLATVQASGAGLSTKLALEFLVLTASRSGEARGALWSEIDFAAKVWTIPALRMKAKRPHRVALSARSLEVLQQARGLSEGEGLVFPGTIKGKPLSDMTLIKLVRELGYPIDIHGFRTSFRTWAQERTTFPREVAEAALAHMAGDAVEQAYARSDLFEKRGKMMEAWAGFIAERRGEVVRIGVAN